MRSTTLMPFVVLLAAWCISPSSAKAQACVYCHVKPAGAVTDELTDFTDLLPTFAELGGAKIPKGTEIDGHSIAPLILGETKTVSGPLRALFSFYEGY